MKKERSILRLLIKRYENSVLSTTGSDRNLRIVCNLQKDFPEYFDYEHFDLAENMNDDIVRWIELGWIKADYDENEEKYQSIELNVNAVDEICEALNLSTDRMNAKQIEALMQKYLHQGIDPYVEDVLNRIRTFKAYKSLVYTELSMQEDVLKSLVEMMKLEEDILQRVFSARVLGNSKSFEKISGKVISIIRKYFSNDEEDDRQLLAQYHILQNPGHLIIKGHGTLQIKDSVVQIEDFKEGLTLSGSDVHEAKLISIRDRSILTIENLTSFYQCEKAETLIIYLGGYHNTIRRDFLKQLYSQFPDLIFLHSGDLDAGGFQILEHLKSKTGIPFKSYKMDTETLQKHIQDAVKLTANDRIRLENLIHIPEYAEVISYMLKYNIKLEQEQIDYTEIH